MCPFWSTLECFYPEKINNNLTNMPCQKGWNFGCHSHSILPAITKHYSITKLQIHLKKNGYASKLEKKTINGQYLHCNKFSQK
jgi:hypothetical protein